MQVPQHHPADINPSYKRPRLAMEPRQDLMIPLKIDTSTTVEVKKVRSLGYTIIQSIDICL